jgi:hypothetical protein
MSDEIKTGEIWKPVPLYEGRYEVSNLGRVRSLDTTCAFGNQKIKKAGKLLKLLPDKDGYLTVTLSINGNHKNAKVHTLVLETFVKARPKNKECRHRNGIPSDNRFKNLSWSSHSRNERDKILHGTQVNNDYKGSKHPRALLTEKDVRKIRRLYKTDHKSWSNVSELTVKFGVSKSTIVSIVRRMSWTHV